MKTRYEIGGGSIVKSDRGDAPVSVYSCPDERERTELFHALGRDWHDLESALDPDEISRVEFGTNSMFVIWKRPNSVEFDEDLTFDVSSVGVFVQSGRVTFIARDKDPVFIESAFRRIDSVHALVFRYFLQVERHFVGHLKAIKQVASELQAKLSHSMENRFFLEISALSESLIYYRNALEGNGAVLAKLRSNADKIELSAEEREILEDVVIENDQCRKQMEVFTTVLSNLMDARSHVLNNNMNLLLKKLTMINIVFLPLNLIAGVGGMSEFTMMTKGMDWRVSYPLFAVGLTVLGWLTWRVLARHMGDERPFRRKKDHS